MEELSNYQVAMINKYGSLDAWKKHLVSIGKKGGTAPHTKPRGFAARPELAAKAGSIGGKISKRKKVVE